MEELEMEQLLTVAQRFEDVMAWRSEYPTHFEYSLKEALFEYATEHMQTDQASKTPLNQIYDEVLQTWPLITGELLSRYTLECWRSCKGKNKLKERLEESEMKAVYYVSRIGKSRLSSDANYYDIPAWAAGVIRAVAVREFKATYIAWPNVATDRKDSLPAESYTRPNSRT